LKLYAVFEKRFLKRDNMQNFDYIKENYLSLIEEIDRISSGIGVKAPTLVPVTKSGTDEELLALFSLAGATALGENRPGELKRRGELLAEAGFFPELHEIGTLQSNKVKLIAERVTLIHSLDSLSLAKEISKQAQKHERIIPVLIEINSGEEPQKSGVLPDEAERFIEQVIQFDNISVRGLMTMGPALDDAEGLRKYFRLTKKLFDKLNISYGFGDTPILSMGMSDSFRVAIEEGSTLVRVGRRLFNKP
jgi:pyridoxal phosphate enzyme (YggS family)